MKCHSRLTPGTGESVETKILSPFFLFFQLLWKVSQAVAAHNFVLLLRDWKNKITADESEP